MLTDCVIPLGSGSRFKNEEIRFSLRSLLANAENLGKIYIIGEKPDFLQFNDRLIHIPYVEQHRPYRNVWEKLRVAAEHSDISERILFTNDDIYLVKHCDAGNVPYYSRGGQLGTMRSGGRALAELRIADINSSYHRVLKHTLMALQRRGLTSYAFSTHQPVNFEKAKILEVYREFERDLAAPYGLSFRCCYCSYFAIERVVRPTHIVKRSWRVPARRLAIASHANADADMLFKNLRRLYPQKSEFERNP